MRRRSFNLWLCLLMLSWLVMALGSPMLHTHAHPLNAQVALQHPVRHVSHDCPACTWRVSSGACSPGVVPLDPFLRVAACALPSAAPAPLNAPALYHSRAPPLA